MSALISVRLPRRMYRDRRKSLPLCLFGRAICEMTDFESRGQSKPLGRRYEPFHCLSLTLTSRHGWIPSASILRSFRFTCRTTAAVLVLDNSSFRNPTSRKPLFYARETHPGLVQQHVHFRLPDRQPGRVPRTHTTARAGTSAQLPLPPSSSCPPPATLPPHSSPFYPIRLSGVCPLLTTSPSASDSQSWPRMENL